MRKLIIIIVLFFESCFILNAKWELLPGVGKSIINDIEFAGDTLYAVAGKGVFHSTNSGSEWIPDKHFVSNEVFPFNRILYFKNSIYACGSKGIFLLNKGKKWESLNDNLNSNYILQLGKNKNNIYALNQNNLFIFNQEKKIWDNISKKIHNSLTSLYVNNNFIYLGTSGNEGEYKSLPIFYISSNNGTSWEAIIDTISGISKYGINCITSNDEFVFAGTNGGLFLSSDNGEHWESLKSKLQISKINCLLYKNKILYVGTNLGIYYSSDNGNNWISIINIPNMDIRSIEMRENNIYVGTVKGLYVSIDNGKNWKQINQGLGGALTWDIATDGKNLYTGTYQQGIYFSSNNGISWNSYDIKMSTSSIFRLIIKDNILFIGFYGSGGLRFTKNNGKTWKKITDSSGLKNSQINFFKIIDNKIFLGTKFGLYISDDNGEHWELLNPELEYYNIHSFIIKNNNIFIGTIKKKILRSTNNGEDWEFLSSGLPTEATLITDLVCLDNKLFASTYNNDPIGFGVFLSTDNGNNWNSIGLINKPIKFLKDFSNNLFLGSQNQVYMSTNYGMVWENISSGLPFEYIEKILFFNQYIFLATSNGVYRAKLSDFGITNVDDNKIEKRNYLYSFPPYPMPAQDIVNALIYWDTGVDIDNDKIDIIDIFGNKIGDRKDIIINKQTPYSGILTWNCSGVSNGIYFILINHGTEKRAVKVMVRK